MQHKKQTMTISYLFFFQDSIYSRKIGLHYKLKITVLFSRSSHKISVNEELRKTCQKEHIHKERSLHIQNDTQLTEQTEIHGSIFFRNSLNSKFYL